MRLTIEGPPWGCVAHKNSEVVFNEKYVELRCKDCCHVMRVPVGQVEFVQTLPPSVKP